MNNWLVNQSHRGWAKKMAEATEPGVKRFDSANHSASKLVTVVNHTTSVVQFQPRNNRRYTIGAKFIVSDTSMKEGLHQLLDSNNNPKSKKGEWIEQSQHDDDGIIPNQDDAPVSEAVDCVATEATNIEDSDPMNTSAFVNTSSGTFFEEPMVPSKKASRGNSNFKVQKWSSLPESKPKKRRNVDLDTEGGSFLQDGASAVHGKKKRKTIHYLT